MAKNWDGELVQHVLEVESLEEASPFEREIDTPIVSEGQTMASKKDVYLSKSERLTDLEKDEQMQSVPYKDTSRSSRTGLVVKGDPEKQSRSGWTKFEKTSPSKSKYAGIIQDKQFISEIKKNGSHKIVLLMGATWKWEYIDFTNCDVNTCVLTDQEQNINESDCVVIHLKPSLKLRKMPHRPLGQPWIYFSMEAPYRSGIFTHTEWEKGQANWTYTVRRDSDFFMPFGKVIPRTMPEVNDFTDAIKNKNRSIAWFVSHCGSESGRDEYAELLQKYINVDIYGSCGNMGKIAQAETATLLDNYFFYLGFENSLCRDYVTEKAFDKYPKLVVPIVRGWANYSHFLPPGSFIDTAYFSTVKDLADYLKYLMQNPKEYAEYFKYKDHFEGINFIKRIQSDDTFLCQLCKRLHDPEKHVRVYKNFQTWWNKVKRKDIKKKDDYYQLTKSYDSMCRDPTDLQ